MMFGQVQLSKNIRSTKGALLKTKTLPRPIFASFSFLVTILLWRRDNGRLSRVCVSKSQSPKCLWWIVADIQNLIKLGLISQTEAAHIFLWVRQGTRHKCVRWCMMGYPSLRDTLAVSLAHCLTARPDRSYCLPDKDHPLPSIHCLYHLIFIWRPHGLLSGPCWM